MSDHETVTVAVIKNKLMKALSEGLDTIKPEDKGFGALVTAALAAVKAFHGEVPPPEASDARAISDKVAAFRNRQNGVAGNA